MEYEYGYHVKEKRIVLGCISADLLEKKRGEVNYANTIDPASRWFVEDGDDELPPYSLLEKTNAP